MYFRQILHEEKSCLSYLIGCDTVGVAAAIDPQGDPKRYIELAAQKGIKIAAVIETHLQADHYSSARELTAMTGATHYLGPGADVRFPFSPLTDGRVFRLGNRRFRVFHTPGHTPESVSILVNDWALLTGDTLFVGDVGRVDLPAEAAGDTSLTEQQARDLHTSLTRLKTLPDWTEIYPAHYGGSVCGRGIDYKPSSTIGREKIKNPALSLPADEFMKFQLENPPALPPEFAAISRVNRGEITLTV